MGLFYLHIYFLRKSLGFFKLGFPKDMQQHQSLLDFYVLTWGWWKLAQFIDTTHTHTHTHNSRQSQNSLSMQTFKQTFLTNSIIQKSEVLIQLLTVN